jgi:hypothetical protein
MNRISTEIRRRELYEQVWNVPMWTLAKKYGLSDVGLAKICKKNDIPRPPRGYWARKKSGRKAQKPPLPGREVERVIIINGHLNSGSESSLERICLKEIYPKEFLKKDIFVPEKLESPHPLVAQSMEILGRSKRDRNGLLEVRGEYCLDIRVSPETLPRAFRIWDSLIKALNEGGFDVALSGGSTEVLINGVALDIAISEQLVRKRKDPRDHDLDGYADHSKPSLNLCLSVGNSQGKSSCSRSWRDSGTQRLENILRRVVMTLLRTAAKITNNREREAREK